MGNVDCVNTYDAIAYLIRPLIGIKRKSYTSEVKKGELLEQKKKIELMLAEGGDDQEFMPRHLIKGYRDEIKGLDEKIADLDPSFNGLRQFQKKLVKTLNKRINEDMNFGWDSQLSNLLQQPQSLLEFSEEFSIEA